MFTNTKCSIYAGQDKVYIESVCLSTDAKPTTGIANGSTCIEMNTGKKFMFNEDSGEWVEVPSSGGGGGGGGGDSDFSIAEVTLIGKEGSLAGDVYLPVKQDAVNGMPAMAYIIANFVANEQHTYNAIMYKGATVGQIANAVGHPVDNITGDAQNMGNGFLLITGDCTIIIS